VGDDVGITPNNTKNQITIIPKPNNTNPFFVPHKFFSNRGILPKISERYEEK
jgi:hypothetical protein